MTARAMIYLRYRNEYGKLDGSKIAELILAYMSRGLILVTNDLDLQWKRDIDHVGVDGKTGSNKYQIGAVTYGNLFFEMKLKSTNFPDTMPGNFAICDSDYYTQLFPLSDTETQAGLFRVSDLKRFVLSPPPPLKWTYKEHLKLDTIRFDNAGRPYNDAEGWLVPVKEVMAMALRKMVIPHAQILVSPEWAAYVLKHAQPGDYWK